MKKDFGVKTWLYPMPVLMIATYNEDGSPNVMNAAWGGTGGEELITVPSPPRLRRRSRLGWSDGVKDQF